MMYKDKIKFGNILKHNVLNNKKSDTIIVV
jgi:hypothetical protein